MNPRERILLSVLAGVSIGAAYYVGLMRGARATSNVSITARGDVNVTRPTNPSTWKNTAYDGQKGFSIDLPAADIDEEQPLREPSLYAVSQSTQISLGELKRTGVFLPSMPADEWVPLTIVGGAIGKKVSFPNSPYSVTFSSVQKAHASKGDVDRYEIRISSVPGQDRVIHFESGWVAMTPDGRYLLTEILTLADVGDWKFQDLSRLIDFPGYATELYYSSGNRKLRVGFTPCIADCPSTTPYFFQEFVPATESDSVQGKSTCGS